MTIRNYLLLLEKEYGNRLWQLCGIGIKKKNGKTKYVDFNQFYGKEEKGKNYDYLNYEFELVIPSVDYGSQLYLKFVLKENTNDKAQS